MTSWPGSACCIGARRCSPENGERVVRRREVLRVATRSVLGCLGLRRSHLKRRRLANQLATEPWYWECEHSRNRKAPEPPPPPPVPPPPAETCGVRTVHGESDTYMRLCLFGIESPAWFQHHQTVTWLYIGSLPARIESAGARHGFSIIKQSPGYT